MLNKKPILYAGISGILLIVLPALFLLLGFFIFPNLFFSMSYVLSLVLSTFFLYGFYIIGKKYKNKFFSVVCLFSILFILIFNAVFFIWSNQVSDEFEDINYNIGQYQESLKGLQKNNASMEEISFIENEMQETLVVFFKPYFIWVLTSLCAGIIIFCLFCISLIGLKKIKYSKTTGILGLVSIGLILTIFGILVAIPICIAYYTMLIIILFNESKKFKEIR